MEIEERQPARVAVGDGIERLVDRDGVVLADGDLDELPRVDLPAQPPEAGELVTADPALENAHRAWRGLTGPLRSEVVVYEAAGADELSLMLRSGVEVRFGRADRIDEKARALGAVLDDLGSREVDVIDVRAPSAPVVVVEE
jgi:cell division septal protein FtsQ